MFAEVTKKITDEIKKVFIGNDAIVEKVLMTIYAGGHIILNDAPGTGKTTLALCFSRALGLTANRIQFTPDTMPSDITGFSVYNSRTGEFEYKPGAVNCQLLLADEINRTSPKTQSALLEAMEEGSVTVDGATYLLPKPFVCIATQNPYGSAGTQALPDSQMDRFMVRLSIGYPENASQVEILKHRKGTEEAGSIQPVISAEKLLQLREALYEIRIEDDVLYYITSLCEATRALPMAELGVSPRGARALVQMARAKAAVSGRDYVVPEDVQAVFTDVCAHRLVLRPQARIEGTRAEDLLLDLLERTDAPAL